MKHKCKHCGTRYREEDGHDFFCCAGCKAVYNMIQEGGLGDFYTRQNGVGLPMKDRNTDLPDFVSIRELQAEAEATGGRKSEAVLGVGGLTCFGCVWLVEHLATRREGILAAKVALSSARVHLFWETGKADLVALAKELDAFGYSLKEVWGDGASLSPLLLRFLLTLMFSINAAIVFGLDALGLGAGGMDPLFSLLLLLSFIFSILVGGQVFFQTAWRAIRMERWHSDLIPAGVLSLLLVGALVNRFLDGGFVWPAVSYFTLLPLLLLSRWLSEVWTLRSA
jgi:Cu2+-exporting ATPase